MFLTVPEPTSERLVTAVLAKEVGRDTAPPPGVSIRISGALDGRQRHLMRPVVDSWCQAPPVIPCSAQAHVDLSEVTQLDPTGLDLLNEAYLRLSSAGWKFRVTAPSAIEARLVLNEAAIHGDLLWA